MTLEHQNTMEDIGRLVQGLNEVQKARLLGFCEGMAYANLGNKESNDEDKKANKKS